MLPMKAVRLQIGALLAADATTFAPPADANTVALVMEDFALTEDLVAADLELATFTGSTPLAQGLGTQLVGIDPLTGEQIVTLEAPAPGWRWECTVAPGAPQTIFGFGWFNVDQTVLLGAAKLDNPIQIAAVGDEINLGAIKVRLVLEPAS